MPSYSGQTKQSVSIPSFLVQPTATNTRKKQFLPHVVPIKKNPDEYRTTCCFSYMSGMINV